VNINSSAVKSVPVFYNHYSNNHGC